MKFIGLFQATMPSTFKHPAHVPMWRGAKVAYFFIAMCLFPVAIGGFWAYGNLVSILIAPHLSLDDFLILNYTTLDAIN